jgi:hypothetical protein
MIYTDDLLAMCVGIDRLVRVLTHWTVTVDALGIQMAGEHKRVISQTCQFIGFALALALGFAYIPAAKVTHALAQLDVLLSSEPVPASAFRSLVGLLGHFHCVLETHASTLHAFHDVLKAASVSPATIIVRTEMLVGAANQWVKFLATSAVAAFSPMISLGVPSAVSRPVLHLFTDASQEGPHVGMGGYLHGHYWHATITGVEARCISVLEILALIISIQTFRPHIGVADVVIHVDNMPVVAVVNGSAHSPSTRRCHAAFLQLGWWQERGPGTAVTYIRSAGNIAADALSRGRADEVVALCRAARIAPREVAAVGGQRALELVLGDAYPAAAPIDTFAGVRFVPALEPPATPRREARARRAAAADITPPPARRVSRRNPPMPHAGVRIGEARHPGPPKAATPVAADDLDSESSGLIWGPGTIIASACDACRARGVECRKAVKLKGTGSTSKCFRCAKNKSKCC